jgi:hypothetical protein
LTRLSPNETKPAKVPQRLIFRKHEVYILCLNSWTMLSVHRYLPAAILLTILDSRCCSPTASLRILQYRAVGAGKEIGIVLGDAIHDGSLPHDFAARLSYGPSGKSTLPRSDEVVFRRPTTAVRGSAANEFAAWYRKHVLTCSPCGPTGPVPLAAPTPQNPA